ncbi:unnamed protein product, partial [Musa textilis]
AAPRCCQGEGGRGDAAQGMHGGQGGAGRRGAAAVRGTGGVPRPPLFAELLDMAAQEYGFNQKGPIAIPCGVDHFRHVSDVIHSDQGGAAGHRLRHFAAHFFRKGPMTSNLVLFLAPVVHCSELKGRRKATIEDH